jgi:hypothetical protein
MEREFARSILGDIDLSSKKWNPEMMSVDRRMGYRRELSSCKQEPSRAWQQDTRAWGFQERRFSNTKIDGWSYRQAGKAGTPTSGISRQGKSQDQRTKRIAQEVDVMRVFFREKSVKKQKDKKLQWNSNSSNIYTFFKLMKGNPWEKIIWMTGLIELANRICTRSAWLICRECDVGYCKIHQKIHDKLHTRLNPTIWIITQEQRWKCSHNNYPANHLHGGGAAFYGWFTLVLGGM